MRWGFIDYENVGNLDKVDLSGYSKIILFLGAKQQKVDLGDHKYDLPLNIFLVQIKAIQTNNLDFHLAYYLGKFDDDAPKEVVFEVISNDNGFNPLLAHIKQTGRICKQIKTTQAPDNQVRLLELLSGTPKSKRPKKVSSLRNQIASHLGLKNNEIAIQNHFNQLVKQKIIQVSGDNILYC